MSRLNHVPRHAPGLGSGHVLEPALHDLEATVTTLAGHPEVPEADVATGDLDEREGLVVRQELRIVGDGELDGPLGEPRPHDADRRPDVGDPTTPHVHDPALALLRAVRLEGVGEELEEVAVEGHAPAEHRAPRVREAAAGIALDLGAGGHDGREETVGLDAEVALRVLVTPAELLPGDDRVGPSLDDGGLALRPLMEPEEHVASCWVHDQAGVATPSHDVHPSIHDSDSCSQSLSAIFSLGDVVVVNWPMLGHRYN